MKRSLVCLIVALSSTAAVSSAQDRMPRRTTSSGMSAPSTSEQPSNATPRPKALDTKFQVLMTTSIFARDRRSASNMSDRVVDPPPAAETYYAFRGAAEENGQKIAFIEDTRDSSTSRVKVGEEIASGKITDITLDSIKYERKNGLTTTKVDIGCNLLGRDAPAPEVASTNSSDNPGNSSNPSGRSVQDLQQFFNQNRNRGFGPGGFGSGGFGSDNGGFRQRGFGPGGSNGGPGGYGADGGAFRQRGMGGGFNGGGGGGYGQQDFGGGGGRRRNRGDTGGGYGG